MKESLSTRRNKQYRLLTAKGKFVRVGTSKDAQFLKLYRETVHVFILNSSGEILITKRPSNALVYPNLWGSSAGGHIEPEESRAKAANRELLEELGLRIPLRYIGKSLIELPERMNIQYLYVGEVRKERVIKNPEEIAAIKFQKITEIQKSITNNPNTFTREFNEALKMFLSGTG